MMILAVALLYAFWNGLTDSPTIIAQMVSTRALSSRRALALTGLLEFVGAIFFSSMVLKTMSFGSLREEFAASHFVSNEISIFVLTAMLVTLIFNAVSWYFGLPTSATHALLGTMIGSSLALGVAGKIILPQLVRLLAVLFGSAILGGLLGWLLTKALFQVHISYTFGKNFTRFSNVFLGGVLALLHGANDTPKSLGLFLLAAGPMVNPNRYLVIFALFISAGMLFGENRILRTLGYKIFRIGSIQGLGASFCGASVVALSTAFGFPVSSTQILVSSILGSGAAKSVRAVRWYLVGEIALSWIITLPLCIGLGFAVTKLLK